MTRLNSAFETRPSPFLSYPRKAAFTLNVLVKYNLSHNYLQELLVLHKRHFWEVVVVVSSDDQVVLTQGCSCIKNSNPEWACRQNCCHFPSEMSKEAQPSQFPPIAQNTCEYNDYNHRPIEPLHPRCQHKMC